MNEPIGGIEPGAVKSGLSTMKAGMVLVALGTLITVVTYLRAAPGERYYQMWGLIVLGLGAMVHGFVQGHRRGGPPARSRINRWGGACLTVLVIAAGGWSGAWLYRAPFWSAVEALSRGDDAAKKLRAISGRHAARMEAGASRGATLDSWQESAVEAIPLREAFAEAAQAARYLREEAGGTTRERAVIDAQFYPLCLEWIDLYAGVQRQIAQESMAEAPLEWEIRQDEIVERIRALPLPPQQGS
ncbi:MAG TPA: hypothetical protein VGK94_09265 [Candidatus Polarisedimenticolia bacterium]